MHARGGAMGRQTLMSVLPPLAAQEEDGGEVGRMCTVLPLVGGLGYPAGNTLRRPYIYVYRPPSLASLLSPHSLPSFLSLVTSQLLPGLELFSLRLFFKGPLLCPSS